MNRFKIAIIFTTMVFAVINQGCQKIEDSTSTLEQSSIFPKGQLAPEKFFTGNAWVTGLVNNDSVFTTAAGNVFFEAGARSNWHSHPSG